MSLARRCLIAATTSISVISRADRCRPPSSDLAVLIRCNSCSPARSRNAIFGPKNHGATEVRGDPVALHGPLRPGSLGPSRLFGSLPDLADTSRLGDNPVDPLIQSGFVLPPHGGMPPPKPTPCSGALCSGNPAVPLSTVPPVMTGGDGGWAISQRPSVLADPGSVDLQFADARLVPIDHPSSIFHPPRRPSPRPTA